jgi:hypothetical protein
LHIGRLGGWEAGRLGGYRVCIHRYGQAEDDGGYVAHGIDKGVVRVRTIMNIIET